jgi:hypothetical protein
MKNQPCLFGNRRDDRINPLMRELADSTNSTIKVLAARHYLGDEPSFKNQESEMRGGFGCQPH